MANYIVILLCLAVGVALKASGRLGQDGSKVINAMVINVSLPAMVLSEIRHLEFSTDLWIAVAAPWLLFSLSCGIVYLVGKSLKWDSTIVGALALTTGLANTSFVGFPLLDALLGPSSLKVGVVVDQLGSFLILSTAAIAVLSFYSKRHSSSSSIWKRLLTFPPLVSVLFALALRAVPAFNEGIANAVYVGIGRIAGTLIPLALISVGLQMTWNRAGWKKCLRPVAFGLTLKLVIAPALLMLLLVFAFGQRGFTTHVALLEIAMAPMITGAILAIDGGLDRDTASAMVFVGIPLSLITVPAWHWVFTTLGV